MKNSKIDDIQGEAYIIYAYKKTFLDWLTRSRITTVCLTNGETYRFRFSDRTLKEIAKFVTVVDTSF